MRRQREERRRFIELFGDAFDELHAEVTKRVQEPNVYVSPHHDYPLYSVLDSGFPHFSKLGFHNKGPLDYTGTVRPTGLIGLLSGYQRPEVGFARGAALVEFARGCGIGQRLELTPKGSWTLDQLVAQAVERYLHRFGFGPVDGRRRDAIIVAIVTGVCSPVLPLRLVVPIALTHFDVDHFTLTDSSYITRIPKPLQLARSRVDGLGTGAVDMVVGAATHAFVATGWTIEGDTINEVRNSLRHLSANVRDAVDIFFGSLRAATGVTTGYAQVVWVPRGWTLDYFCELPPVYGANTRQYPSHFDNYAWAYGGHPTISANQLVQVRRIYRALLANQQASVSIATKRLNSALVRSDAADALLDATIGLEVLLGDSQNQSLSYKLRLRAGALALLEPGRGRTATEVSKAVNKVYDARSSIVHGLKRSASKRAAEPDDVRYLAERDTATDLLRFVLDVLLDNPAYLDPAKIDELILLRGADNSG